MGAGTDAEESLLSALSGVKGRGSKDLSSQQQSAFDDAVAQLEADAGVAVSTRITTKYQSHMLCCRQHAARTVLFDGAVHSEVFKLCCTHGLYCLHVSCCFHIFHVFRTVFLRKQYGGCTCDLLDNGAG